MAGTAAPVRRTRHDFRNTFMVLVGNAKVDQHCFTVHHDLFTQRSAFLKAARSPQCLSNPKTPVDLTDHCPDTFAEYMHCVYHNEVAPLARDGCFMDLLHLYLLADKLQDPQTANMVIDQMIRNVDEAKRMPGQDFLKVAYGSTAPGNPIRKLFMDYLVRRAAASWLKGLDESMTPYECLRDIAAEFARVGKKHTEAHIECAKRERCYYHQ